MTPYTSPREPDEYNLARCAEGRSIQAYPAHEPGNGTASIIHPAAGHRNQGNLQLELSLIALRFPAGSLDRHNQHARVSSFRELRHRKQGYKKR